jgi:hypothetical protein
MTGHAGHRRRGTLLTVALLVAGPLVRRWLASGLPLQSSPEPQNRGSKKDDKKDGKDRKKEGKGKGDKKDKKGKGRRASRGTAA